MLGRSIEWSGRVLVVALSDEVLLGATTVALGLETEVDELVFAHIGPGEPWAPWIASWYAEQERNVRVMRFEGDVAGFDRVVAVGTSLNATIPAAIREHPEALFALVAAGSNAAELDAIRARLLELGATGALRGVEHIARFERVGREYVELIEHVHHLAGPPRQSRVADTIRAALFGKSGLVPVNLASREDPPMLDPLTTMVFFVAVDEI